MRYACVPVILAGVMVAMDAAAQADGQFEGVSFGVEEYGGGGECCSECSPLQYPNQDAAIVKSNLVWMGVRQTSGG